MIRLVFFPRTLTNSFWRAMRTLSLLVVWMLSAAALAGADSEIPHLRQQGSATQLVVDGAPFLIRGGEIGNSAATNPAYLRQFWPKFAALNMNTVLVPVYWDLVEPEEGRFDFSTVDQIVGQAREHSMRLVLLWFGSWKNSMSCYAPAWVKRDPQRFPRATDLNATRQEEILSPFSAANRDADARAFGNLLKHLREADGTRHTVAGKQAGILSAEEGRVVDGRWENVRWLGGDETHQGRHIRLEPGAFSIQRVKLYAY